jgi:uncharacterized protein YbjT (DUF2867 family)
MSRTGLVIGASGLIGRNLVFELLKNKEYSKVTVLVRRDMVIKHDKLNQIMLDFDQLENYTSDLAVTDVFCCMGSTKAKTPDIESYREVDFNIPLRTARLAKAQGAKRFILISSLGASLDSSIFYSRLKAELEEAIKAINFEHFLILRPSLLLGSRKESRPLETVSQYLMRVLNPIFIGPLKQYRAIQGIVVAKAMVNAALTLDDTFKILPNEVLFKLGS